MFKHLSFYFEFSLSHAVNKITKTDIFQPANYFNITKVKIIGERTIDVHIRKLREKLGDSIIRTIKGVGYTFSE